MRSALPGSYWVVPKKLMAGADNVLDTIAWMRRSGGAGQEPSPETEAQRSFVKNWPVFDRWIRSREGR